MSERKTAACLLQCNVHSHSQSSADRSLYLICQSRLLQVAEELVIWDYEALLTEMASALHADKDELYHSTARTGQQIAV